MKEFLKSEEESELTEPDKKQTLSKYLQIPKINIKKIQVLDKLKKTFKFKTKQDFQKLEEFHKNIVVYPKYKNKKFQK